MQNSPKAPRRGLGHFYGKKQAVLSPEAAKQKKADFAQFQAAVAEERERVAKLAQDPNLRCSACGAKWTAGTCEARCAPLLGRQRSHGVVFVPHADLIAEHQANLAAAAKAAEEKAAKDKAPPPGIKPALAKVLLAPQP